MCLVIVKGQEPLTAQQDLVVYKGINRFGNIIKSNFYDFTWELNKLYLTEMQLSEDKCCFDFKEYLIVESLYGEWKFSDKIQMVGKGFHSTTNKMRLLDYSLTCASIARCIIPAGSLYYVGIDSELIVSNQIIITDEIRDLSVAKTDDTF